MDDKFVEYISMLKHFNNDVMKLNIKYCDEIEELRDKILELETERDVLKSKLLETKADIKYLLRFGEGNGYIRKKYSRDIVDDEGEINNE